jgi:hypothetical protein
MGRLLVGDTGEEIKSV